MKVYLDNAATTPLDERVLAKMKPYFSLEYANASAIHFMGQKNNLVLASARLRVAKVLHAEPGGIVFTSGASEANNFILRGVMAANRDKGNHLIVSAIEHPCVYQTAKNLKAEGYEVDFAPIKSGGLVDLEALAKMIKPTTVLVSIMAVNNEIGVIQDLKKIAALIHKKGAYFHSDIVQAIPWLKIDLDKMGIDLASLSAHKFYGPKGVGLAYGRKGIKIKALIAGGEQENGLRAGTYNLPGIVGLTEALELAYKEREKNIKKIKQLRDYLAAKIKKDIPSIKINGSLKARTPNNLNVMFHGIEGEAILMDLSLKGICVSTGSACSAHNLKTSYVLQALGLSLNDLNSNIRFSLGKYNTKAEIDYTVKCLKETVKRLRSFSPIK
ncbi:MAG: cysteine desulfurase family protein [Candidatus Falkowbacteria bacterium]|nr:cysteine desulfurase family protein [Candidatus Falkowbacteria bacterium]